MFKRALLLIAILAVSNGLAHAEASSPEGAVFMCTAADSHFRIALVDADEAKATTFATREVVDYDALITWTEPKDGRDPMRTGSTTKRRTCGAFTIAIKGGFYNSNIQGELGAADNFPALEITSQNKTVKISLAYPSCGELSGREGAALGEHIGAFVDGGLDKASHAATLALTKVCDDGGQEQRTTETITFK